MRIADVGYGIAECGMRISDCVTNQRAADLENAVLKSEIRNGKSEIGLGALAFQKSLQAMNGAMELFPYLCKVLDSKVNFMECLLGAGCFL
jgi:hypothetical protein